MVARTIDFRDVEGVKGWLEGHRRGRSDQPSRFAAQHHALRRENALRIIELLQPVCGVAMSLGSSRIGTAPSG